MRRVWVAVGALALASCNSGASDADPEAASATPSATPATVPPALAGTYGGSGGDGRPWRTVLEADGTYRNIVAEEETERGTWSQSGDQLCFVAAVDAGETAEQTCRTLVNVNDDGSLVLRDPSGAQTTATRIPPQ